MAQDEKVFDRRYQDEFSVQSCNIGPVCLVSDEAIND